MTTTLIGFFQHHVRNCSQGPYGIELQTIYLTCNGDPYHLDISKLEMQHRVARFVLNQP